MFCRQKTIDNKIIKSVNLLKLPIFEQFTYKMMSRNVHFITIEIVSHQTHFFTELI